MNSCNHLFMLEKALMSGFQLLLLRLSQLLQFTDMTHIFNIFNISFVPVEQKKYLPCMCLFWSSLFPSVEICFTKTSCNSILFYFKWLTWCSLFWSHINCSIILASVLNLSWRRSLSYRNQSIDFQNKSKDWFVYDRDLHHERVKANGWQRP